jgi:organic hydroperoxide reductase OsmC/OhrA
MPVACALITFAQAMATLLTCQKCAAMGPGHQKKAKEGGRKYHLFAAAHAGCLECVQKLVLHEGIDPNSQSTRCKYSVQDWADWGYKQTGKLAVVTWLREYRAFLEQSNALANDFAFGSSGSAASVCPGPDKAHQPTQKSYKRTRGRQYFLFTAAEAGCLKCVQKLVLEEGIDPKSTSTTCGYSVEDFAEWGYEQTKNEGCHQVFCWLRRHLASLESLALEDRVSSGSGDVESSGVLPRNSPTRELTGVWRHEESDRSRSPSGNRKLSDEAA